MRITLSLTALALLGMSSLAAAQPSQVDQLVSSGWENYRNGLYREAIREFSSALVKDPENASAAEGKGAAAMQLQDWPKAKMGYEAAHRLSPENCSVTKSLAYVYMRLNLSDRAGKLYEEVVGVPGKPGCEPGDNNSKTNLGYLYYRSKDEAKRAKAIQLFNQVLNSGEENENNLYRCYYYLGNLYLKNKSYDLAIQNLEKAFEIQPEKKEGRFNLGRLYFNKKEYEKALEHLIIALEDKETDFNTNLMLGLSYEAEGGHDEDAVYYLAKAANLVRLMDKTPKNLPHQPLAKLYNKLGEPNKAIATSNEGLELATNSSERAGLTCTKAKGYEKKGKYEEAIELFEAVLDDPTWGGYGAKQIERQENLIQRRDAQQDK